MRPQTLLLASAVALVAPSASSAFSPSAFAAPRRVTTATEARPPSSTSLSAVSDPSFVADALLSAASSASTYLSTIDSDIDSIPTDQFGKVFAGGLVVMAGGLVSALIVGAILEGGNNYANVIADSYAQGGDESFWESLTPEQREETERLLKRVKESKDGGRAEEAGEGKAVVAAEAIASEPKGVVTEVKKSEKSTEERSMFSDYD